jgi:ferredoxin-type protein NapG
MIALLVAGIYSGGAFWFARLAHSESRLRPPGAADEQAFLASCIKCGQCVQVCPYHSLILLDADQGLAVGTPIVDPLRRGCYLCDLLPCVLACPSGALSHDVTEARQVKMGIAVVDNPRQCLSYQKEPVTQTMVDRLIAHGNQSDVEKDLANQLNAAVGKPCTLCLDHCPYPDKTSAITMQNFIPEIGKNCVGCGVCAELCPPQIIRMIPRKTYASVYENLRD